MMKSHSLSPVTEKETNQVSRYFIPHQHMIMETAEALEVHHGCTKRSLSRHLDPFRGDIL